MSALEEIVEQRYKLWLGHVNETDRAVMVDMDEKTREDAFYHELAFGTGGLRAKVGIGPNRLNSYTVAKATQGLANYLNTNYEDPSVVLCRDTRRGSEEFVRRVAEVFAANGIKSFLFERVEPTPTLSFAVRELHCSAGVNITASHNPAAYNGYKVYGADGCQITVGVAHAIQTSIDPIDCFDDVRALPISEAISRDLVQWVPENVLDRYVEETLKVSTGEDCADLRVVYTPLHGVGHECVSRVLKGINVSEIIDVEEQCVQDGDFPTCPYPNPEVRDALELGLAYCEKTHPDLLLATDPDADRVGIAVSHDGEYKLLTGNEVGLLLLDFLIEKAVCNGAGLSHKVAYTTVVSAPMADDLALARGIELRRTLTGFKFIGEQIGALESQGCEDDFLVGIEESYGYLVGTAVRDKDAVLSTMLICELAAYWKSRGFDLCDAMELLYKRYGYWADAQVTRAYEGPQGAVNMEIVMARLREHAPCEFAGLAVMQMIDYTDGAKMPTVNPVHGEQKLPPANVVELRLEDGSRVLFRPSGTEPKAKAYVFAKGKSRVDAISLLAALCDAAARALEGEV